MRDKLLEEKAQSISMDLEQWATEVKLLLPGEHLVFSLHISTRPIVVREHGEDDLNMSPEDFFTKERLMRLGMGKSNASRMVTAILNINSGWSSDLGDGHKNYKTARAFIAAWGNESRLLRCKNIGSKSIRGFLEAMKKVSFSIDR